MLLLKCRELRARNYDFPDLAVNRGQKCFRRIVSEQLTLGEYGDIRRDGFDVRNDVSRKDDDALAGKFGEEIAKTDAFFRIEARSGFIRR